MSTDSNGAVNSNLLVEGKLDEKKAIRYFNSLVNSTITSTTGNDLDELNQTADTYYYGFADKGLEPEEGGLRYVYNVVKPTVNAVTNQVAKPIVGPRHKIFKLEPANPHSVLHIDGAKQTSDIIRHIFRKHNNWYFTASRWIKDAALHINGTLKVAWHDTMIDDPYKLPGLTEEQVDVWVKTMAGKGEIGDENDVKKEKKKGTEKEIPNPEYIPPQENADAEEQQALAQAVALIDEEGPGEPKAEDEILGSDNTSGDVPQTIKVWDWVVTVKRPDLKCKFINVKFEDLDVEQLATSVDDAVWMIHSSEVTYGDVIKMFPDADPDMIKKQFTDINFTERREAEDNRRRVHGNDVNTSQRSESGVNAPIIMVDVEASIEVETNVYRLVKMIWVGDYVLYRNDNLVTKSYASISLDFIPHSFWGTSVAHDMLENQKLLTGLLRQHLMKVINNNKYRPFVKFSKVDWSDLQHGLDGPIKVDDDFDGTKDVKDNINSPPSPDSLNVFKQIEANRAQIAGQHNFGDQIQGDALNPGNAARKVAQVFSSEHINIDQKISEFNEMGIRPLVNIIRLGLFERGEHETVKKLAYMYAPKHVRDAYDAGDIDHPWIDYNLYNSVEMYAQNDVNFYGGLGFKSEQENIALADTVIAKQAELEKRLAETSPLERSKVLAAYRDLFEAMGVSDPDMYLPSNEKIAEFDRLMEERIKREKQEQAMKQQKNKEAYEDGVRAEAEKDRAQATKYENEIEIKRRDQDRKEREFQAKLDGRL